MEPREKFLEEVYVLDVPNDEYVHVVESNQYEIKACTPERPGNSGAVLVEFEDRNERWFPKSVVAIDSDETLYLKEWFFDKTF